MAVNLLKTKYLSTLLFVLGLSVASFLFAFQVKAVDIGFEESEGYELGNIIGQNGWYTNGTATATITMSNSYRGAYSVKWDDSYSEQSIRYNIATSSIGKQCVAFNAEAYPACYVGNYFFEVEGITMFVLDCAGGLGLATNPGNYYLGQIDLNSWGYYCLEWDNTGHSGYAKAQVITQSIATTTGWIDVNAGIQAIAVVFHSPQSNWTEGTYAHDYYYDSLNDDLLAEGAVVIKELDNYDYDELYMSSENFDFPAEQECLIATSCPVSIRYGNDDVGKEVFFMYEDEETLAEYTDYVLLDDIPVKKKYLYPTVRNEETIDIYNYWVTEPDSATGTLYTSTKIYWVTSLSEDSEGTNALGRFINRLKNLFPLSLIFQMRDISKNVKNNTESTDYADIKLSYFLPNEYESLVGSTTSLFNKEMIEDHLPVWSTHIKPAIDDFIYLINFLFLALVLFKLNKKDGKAI